MAKIDARQVVLEELLTAAIKAGRQAAQKYRASGDRFEEGRAFALYDLITVAQEQAGHLGIEFADKTLAEFDPDKELLLAKPKAA
ncbi:MAG: hypothetical protein IPG66_05875 [Hydrogenophilales bacterium]|nr:hypothetical protein [Hydrogenophilales bacterium]